MDSVKFYVNDDTVITLIAVILPWPSRFDLASADTSDKESTSVVSVVMMSFRALLSHFTMATLALR